MYLRNADKLCDLYATLAIARRCHLDNSFYSKLKQYFCPQFHYIVYHSKMVFSIYQNVFFHLLFCHWPFVTRRDTPLLNSYKNSIYRNNIFLVDSGDVLRYNDIIGENFKCFFRNDTPFFKMSTLLFYHLMSVIHNYFI